MGFHLVLSVFIRRIAYRLGNPVDVFIGGAGMLKPHVDRQIILGQNIGVIQISAGQIIRIYRACKHVQLGDYRIRLLLVRDKRFSKLVRGDQFHHFPVEHAFA
ncbi:hypothetical protein D3C87_1713160 [compost metagenome]